MPQISADHERWILLLMNVLMIEVRAEKFFNFCTTVMRDPRNFRDRRDVAMHAADLVDRIRQDEAPHVGYLTVVVSELRSFTFKLADGNRVKGSSFIDPIWRGMVQWHSVSSIDYDREQTRKEFAGLLGERPNGVELMRQFDNLGQKEAA
jgi:enoyl-CoA hydratase/carnithine racemase